MWQKQPWTNFGGCCVAQSTWLAWPNQLAAKVRVRFMVMVWLEGGQGEVRGACAPPPPRPPPSPPQISPPGPPPQPTLPIRPSPQDKSCARGCAGQCELPQCRGRGMLPSALRYPPPVPPTGRSPPPFGGGRRGGLGTAPGCRQQDHGVIAGRTAATKSARTWSQKVTKKGFRSCEKAKHWRVGQIDVKFVRNSYEIRTNFVRISYEFDSLVNL